MGWGEQRGIDLHSFAHLVWIFFLIAIESNCNILLCEVCLLAACRLLGRAEDPFTRRMERTGRSNCRGDCEELGSCRMGYSGLFWVDHVWLLGTMGPKQTKSAQKSKVKKILLPLWVKSAYVSACWVSQHILNGISYIFQCSGLTLKWRDRKA